MLEDYPEAGLKWCQSQGIQFMVCPHHTVTVSRIRKPNEAGSVLK